MGGVRVSIGGCPRINWGVSAYQLGGVHVSIRGCPITIALNKLSTLNTLVKVKDGSFTTELFI